MSPFFLTQTFAILTIHHPSQPGVIFECGPFRHASLDAASHSRPHVGLKNDTFSSSKFSTPLMYLNLDLLCSSLGSQSIEASKRLSGRCANPPGTSAKSTGVSWPSTVTAFRCYSAECGRCDLPFDVYHLLHSLSRPYSIAQTGLQHFLPLLLKL